MIPIAISVHFRFPLIADDANFWRDPSQMFPAYHVAIVAGVVLAIFGFLWVRQWYQRARIDSTPMVLFHQLAGELGINLQDRWVLVKISRQQGLPTPLTLLLSGPTLTHHAGLYVQSLPESKRSVVAARVASIGHMMFGEGKEADGPVEPALTRQPSPPESSMDADI